MHTVMEAVSLEITNYDKDEVSFGKEFEHKLLRVFPMFGESVGLWTTLPARALSVLPAVNHKLEHTHSHTCTHTCTLTNSPP